MPRQLAVLDQRRHRRLGGEVALDVEQRAEGADASQHRRRSDDVADAQSGGEDLGHRPDVHDEPRVVGARQRKHGTAVVMEFVVVIVLDDRHAPGARESEEREAARRLQRHSRWILMMRRDIDGAELAAVCQRRERGDVQAIAVDRDRDDGRSGGSERFDSPVSPAEDERDNVVNVTPHVDQWSNALYEYLPGLSSRHG